MAISGFWGRSELSRALWAFRREFLVVAVFSVVANVLLLVPTLYMLQVYDRVMVSRSELTLLVVSLIALFLFLVAAFSEWMRSRVLVRAGARLDAVLSTRVFNASFESNLKQFGTSTAKAFGDLVQLRQFVTGNGIFALFDAPWALVYLAVVFFLHPMLGYLAPFFAALQAARSILSSPTPSRPTACSFGPAASSCAVTLVRLRTIRARASARARTSSAGLSTKAGS